jgi:hypothetical protein
MNPDPDLQHCGKYAQTESKCRYESTCNRESVYLWCLYEWPAGSIRLIRAVFINKKQTCREDVKLTGGDFNNNKRQWTGVFSKRTKKRHHKSLKYELLSAEELTWSSLLRVFSPARCSAEAKYSRLSRFSAKHFAWCHLTIQIFSSIRIRTSMFLGIPDPYPDPLVTSTDPDPSLFS